MKMMNRISYSIKILAVFWGTSFIALSVSIPFLHNHPHDVADHEDCPAYILQISLQSNSVPDSGTSDYHFVEFHYFKPMGFTDWTNDFYVQNILTRGPPPCVSHFS